MVMTKKELYSSYQNLLVDNISIAFRPLNESLEDIESVEDDIVIIDCDFDASLGFEILRRIKAVHPEIPVIFIASHGSEDTVIKAYRTGAREYFKTPLNMLELKSTIEELLRLRGVSSERRFPFCLSGVFDEATNLVPSTTPPNILRAACRILNDYSEKLSLDELAKEAGMSKYHFCRSFNKHFGRSPMKFVTYIRIQRSLELLRRKNMSVSMIADEVGYSDPGNFIRHFKKLTGHTPSAYKVMSTNEPAHLQR